VADRISFAHSRIRATSDKSSEDMNNQSLIMMPLMM